MRTHTKAAAILASAIVAVTLVITGCSSSPSVVASSSPSNTNDVSQSTLEMDRDAVAATAGGLSVTEGEIADYIGQYRTYIGAADDVSFATLLDHAGMTPEDARAEAIEHIMSSKLAEQKAAQEGIEVTDEEIDDYIANVRDDLGYADNSKGWTDTLSISGYDEATYRADVRMKLILERLVGEQAGDMAATETKMLSYAKENPTDYVGANIIEVMFKANQRGAAQAFAKEANGKSESEFRALAASEVGSGKAEKVDNWGWTCINVPSSAVIQLVADMQPSECSVVQDDDGTYKAVYIAAIFTLQADGYLDYSNMPEEIKAKLRSDASEYNRELIASEYLAALYSTADVIIADIPNDAPYNVDMTLSTYGEDDSVSDEEIQQSADDQISAMESSGLSVRHLTGEE